MVTAARSLVGIDVGGTKIAVVAVRADEPNEPTASARVPTPRGEEALVEAIVEAVEGLDVGELVGAGVGIAGLIDRSGVVRTSPNLPEIEELDLTERLGERLGCEVRVDNDANTAALAESTFGAGAREGTTIFVALGTGIGGAVVVDGELQRGADGFAGEFGHMIVERDGVLCFCGRRGCWERYASGSALERLADEAGLTASKLGLTGGAVTGEVVLASARDSHPLALEVVDEFVSWIGLGLTNLISAYDPDRVLIGGGVADAADVLLEPVRHFTEENTFGALQRRPLDLRVATLGSEAGARGAVLLFGRD